MDIAGLSAVMAQRGVRQQAAIQIADKAIDITKQQGADLLKLMEASMANSINPHIGGSIDLKL